jgi:pimeloyl-ACP methyl ester carboxylesterase
LKFPSLFVKNLVLIPAQLLYKKSIIGYQCFGSGPELAVCFHGYGEDCSAFSFLEKHAGREFRFIAIDLPFHGNTKWNEGVAFTINDLRQIIEKILKAKNPALEASDPKFSLIGFSLGGRMALHLYQYMPDRIEKLVLLAPDGVKVNCWYWLATQTWAGNKLFALTMKKPAWFFGLLKLMNRLKLINASIFKFVNYYIGDAAVRNLLYTRWTALRKIKPSIPVVKKSIAVDNTPVRLVYGKHDRIIRFSVAERFRQGIENNCVLTIIPSGHQVLHEKHAGEIVFALLN